jgi:transposase
MTKQDARFLSLRAQEDLRRRVVIAVRGGMYQAEAARSFGVSRKSVNNWMKRCRSGGLRRLRSGRRGRPPVQRLAPYQAATAVRLITDRCPDQLQLSFALWTREAVGELLARRFGVQVSVWTVGRYLRRWGFTPQKPVRRAYERDPEAVRQWLREKYPAILARAKRDGAEIHWGDEMGLRSDHQAGRSWGRRGQTPVIPGTGKRFGCNMISTITNRGRLYFMVFKERFNARGFIRFLKRLLRQVGRKVVLIVDEHPAHRARETTRWLKGHGGQIQLHFLPPYSPELNPDELLNQDVKTNALGRVRPINVQEMMDNVRSYLRITQARPTVVKNYFCERHVRYAAS